MILIDALKKFIKKGETKMKFEQIADEWLEYKRNSIKESTYCKYMLIIGKHLKPEFAECEIEKIDNYNKFIQKISRKFRT